jgi:hypothetical protein
MHPSQFKLQTTAPSGQPVRGGRIADGTLERLGRRRLGPLNRSITDPNPRMPVSGRLGIEAPSREPAHLATTQRIERLRQSLHRASLGLCFDSLVGIDGKSGSFSALEPSWSWTLSRIIQPVSFRIGKLTRSEAGKRTDRPSTERLGFVNVSVSFRTLRNGLPTCRGSGPSTDRHPISFALKNALEARLSLSAQHLVRVPD